MAPLVGLTGGIGAGKSEALRALGELGAATLSTDAVVHELLAEPEVRDLGLSEDVFAGAEVNIEGSENLRAAVEEAHESPEEEPPPEEGEEPPSE